MRLPTWSVFLILAHVAFASEQLCLPLLVPSLTGETLERQVSFLESKGLLQSKVTADGSKWYAPGAHIGEYVKQISGSTVEIIVDEGHLVVRIGSKAYHMLPNGIRIEDFSGWITKVQEAEHRAVGLVLQASPEEIQAIETYFIEAEAGDLEYSKFRNNCSQTVCRALQAAKVHDPKSAFEALFPALTGKALSLNPRLKFRISYQPLSTAMPDKFLNSAWSREVIPQGIRLSFIAGMTATVGGLVAAPFLMNNMDNERTNAIANRALNQKPSTVSQAELNTSLEVLSRRQAQLVHGPDFEKSFLTYVDKNSDRFNPYLISIGIEPNDLHAHFSKVFSRHGAAILYWSYLLALDTKRDPNSLSVLQTIQASGIPTSQ